MLTKQEGEIVSTPVAIGEVANVTYSSLCCCGCTPTNTQLFIGNYICNIGNITAFRTMKCLNDISNGHIFTDIVSILVHPSGFHDDDRFGFPDQQVFQQKPSSDPSHERKFCWFRENTTFCSIKL